MIINKKIFLESCYQVLIERIQELVDETINIPFTDLDCIKDSIHEINNNLDTIKYLLNLINDDE